MRCSIDCAGTRLTEPIATTRTLADLPDPALPDPTQAVTLAEAESPELKKALLAGEQAGRRVELAEKERWPDLTVSAGVMPRWGDFPTMWQAGVAFNLPIWGAQKQSRAVAENRARGEAARDGAEAIRQLLRQRIHERLAALGALVEANHLYRSGLLVQSDATVSSTLSQYQVGRVTFASVLEALSGYLADVNGFLRFGRGGAKDCHRRARDQPGCAGRARSGRHGWLCDAGCRCDSSFLIVKSIGGSAARARTAPAHRCHACRTELSMDEDKTQGFEPSESRTPPVVATSRRGGARGSRGGRRDSAAQECGWPCAGTAPAAANAPAAEAEKKTPLYQCPMHPTITSDHPGDCPICGMKLVPVASACA